MPVRELRGVLLDLAAHLAADRHVFAIRGWRSELVRTKLLRFDLPKGLEMLDDPRQLPGHLIPLILRQLERGEPRHLRNEPGIDNHARSIAAAHDAARIEFARDFE